MLGKYLCINGKFLPVEQGRINVDNIEFTYGFGVYEGLKLRKGKVMFVEEHAERLLLSAQQINLEHNFTAKQIIGWAKNLVKKNQVENSHVKILLIGGAEAKDAKIFMFLLAPRFVDKKVYRDGVKAIVREYERFLPQVKSLNMLPSYLFFREAKVAGAFDCLLTNKKGEVLEGTRSNFYVIKNKIIYTAPLKLVLDGVTRRTVLDCARKNGYKIVERAPKLKEVFKYDGAFFTNTSGKVMPIREIGGKRFGEICECLKELVKLYNEYLEKFER